MKTPSLYTVSVIVTVYNRKKLLKRAVSSLLKQTWKDFEVIIVDDGSTDGVEKYASRLVLNNKNFKYIKQANTGNGFALNTGISAARGKFITILDSDDEYAPYHLESRVMFFKKNKDTDLVHSTAKLIGNEKDMYVPDVRDNRKLIHVNDCIISGTLFGKREVFIQLKGFKNMYSHDSDFYKRARRKFTVKKLELPTYIYYRNSPDSIITQLKKKN